MGVALWRQPVNPLGSGTTTGYGYGRCLLATDLWVAGYGMAPLAALLGLRWLFETRVAQSIGWRRPPLSWAAVAWSAGIVASLPWLHGFGWVSFGPWLHHRWPALPAYGEPSPTLTAAPDWAIPVGIGLCGAAYLVLAILFTRRRPTRDAGPARPHSAQAPRSQPDGSRPTGDRGSPQ